MSKKKPLKTSNELLNTGGKWYSQKWVEYSDEQDVDPIAASHIKMNKSILSDNSSFGTVSLPDLKPCQICGVGHQFLYVTHIGSDTKAICGECLLFTWSKE